MGHIHQLIIDLALILGSAGIITLIFKRLRQPLVLGYIIAGLLVSPNFSLFPTITDTSTIKVWADIGVIFLLFSLGLEFSFKKLVKVGGSSAVTGVYEVFFMLLFGYITGQLLGWSFMDSLFLGGIISISSTTIIIRAFDELGVKTQKFAGLVLGVLVIEDLVAVLLLVLLSTVAVSRQFSGGEMLYSVLKLLFFLILWFLCGIYLLPTFLKRTRRLINDETLLVLALGLCLMMVIVATKAGFSAALGAFIMGSILAETVQGEKILHLVTSVKDLFGAVFFVSVGMLINLSLLAEYIVPVILLALVVILGKTLNATIGSLIAGQPLKQSLQTGMSLSQIGEFSFIIATLGLDLGVTSNFLYPIAVGVSVLTTFTSPYMIRLSEPLYNWLEKKLPAGWIAYLNRYSSGTQKIQTTSAWRLLLRAYLRVVVINLVIIVGIILVTTNYLEPFIAERISDLFTVRLLTAVITLLLITPFLWALGFRRIERLSFSKLWLDKVFNRGPLVLLEMFRVLCCILIIGFLLNQVFSVKVALGGAVVVIVLVSILFSRRLQAFYSHIERRFLTNLHAKEEEDANKMSSDLIPWDGHLAYFDIAPEAGCVGKTLLELSWRERYGINVARIERGKRVIHIPGRDERLYPADRIAVIGTDQQLEDFSKALDGGEQAVLPDEGSENITLRQITIQPKSLLVGKSIREADIRNRTQGLIVGIERAGERQLNPDSSYVFREGDLVWIVGDKERIRRFIQ